MAFLIRWLVLTLAVWVSTFIVTGIRYDNAQALIVAALVLGVLNSLVRPVLVLISLPIVVLTLGLFLVIINALLILLTAKLVSGFHVAGFWSAVGASLIVSIVSMLFGVRRRRPRRVVVNGPVYPGPGPGPEIGPPPGKGPIIDV